MNIIERERTISYGELSIPIRRKETKNPRDNETVVPQNVEIIIAPKLEQSWRERANALSIS